MVNLSVNELKLIAKKEVLNAIKACLNMNY